jgi:hypothetical protein
MVKVRWAEFGFLSALFLVLETASCFRGHSDPQVTAEAQNRIRADGRIQTKQVHVNANNGILTLSGAAGSDVERVAAAEDASQIEGVKVVVNNLQVIDASRQRETMPIQTTGLSIVTLPGSSKARITLGNRIPYVAPPLDRERHPVVRGKTAEATTARRVPASPAREVVPAALASSDWHSSEEKAAAGTVIASPALPQTTAAPVAALPTPSEKVTVPYGSVLSVRLQESVSSDLNQPGDNFLASLASPVMVGNRVVIPAEAGLQGKIVEARSAGRFAGRSSLALELTRLAYNGKAYQLRTSQYSEQGPARDTRSAATIGGGVGVGAILGAILGGGKGAAIGAVIGAGVGTGVQARTKGAQVRLPAESLLSFRLETPLEVAPSSTLQGAQNVDPGSSPDPFSDDRPVLKRRPGSRGADPSPDNGSPDPAPILQPRPN